MRAVIQRVSEARLTVDGKELFAIGKGLVTYVGIEDGDKASDVDKFCNKIVLMRIFSDENGKMNLSVNDIAGDILVVSNFTLCADISHGNRPSFTFAMNPVDAEKLFDYCVESLKKAVKGNVGCGKFGADMKIAQSNDGPVTIVY